ncbi:MAG: carboxypeptidase regulatory-like domain-containing protein [Sphingobacteriaceae bacterium]|nr:carboxypeptidase regulatory-like domain-containing protein [Sphingobacteriaceae bacterium]
MKQFLFANVVVYQNGVQVAVATTDMEGRCAFKNLVPGKYDFKAIYIGYMAQEIKRVDVFAEKTTWLNIKLKGGNFTMTCCCSCFCYDDRTENWWPKLWTPYREAYKAWKEKKEKKQAPRGKTTEERN